MTAPTGFEAFGHGMDTAVAFRPLLVYAVVSAETEKAVETFVRREDAERFLADVKADDPEVAAEFGIALVELDA